MPRKNHVESFGGTVRADAIDRGLDQVASQRIKHRQLCAAIAVVYSLLGCHDETVFVGKLPGAPAAAPLLDAGSRAGDAATLQPADAAVSSVTALPGPRADLTPYLVQIETGSYSELCNGSGSVLTSKPAAGSPAACDARVERRVFGYGLCACEELRVEGESFLIDSFDSSAGPYAAGQTGGNIGLSSARLTLADRTEILGSLSIAGTETVTLAATNFLVIGDLKSNAALQLSSGTGNIARDLWAGSDLLVPQGTLRVARDVYQAAGHNELDAASVGGSLHRGAFHVPEPCQCTSAAPIDVAALVAQASQHNDNAAASFDPSTLAVDSFVTDRRVLPCGRLYGQDLTLNGLSTFTWAATSRSALFLQGDLRVAEGATLTISAQLSGELDLFVAGDIVVAPNSTLWLGSALRTAAMRVFVAGQIESQGTIALAAQLYAPHASFSTATNGVELDQYGAVYARSIRLVNDRFHYDRAILNSGPDCVAAQPVSCGSCHECPDGLACTASTCQPCAADSDCCDPAVCTDGKCQALVSSWP